MTVAALHEIADRLGRLRPDIHNYEFFIEQRSEIVAALRAAALPPRCRCMDRLPVPRPRRGPEPDEQARRWGAVLAAKEREIAELRRLLASAARPVRRRAREADPRQLGLALPNGQEAGR